MKHVAMAFLAMILIVPCTLISSASPQRAAAATLPAFRDGGPEPFGTPFVRDLSLLLPPGTPSAESAPFTVPAGKLLIAEFASATVTIDGFGSLGTFAAIRVTKDAEVHDYNLYAAKTGAPDWYVASQMVRFYAPAGATVSLVVNAYKYTPAGGGAQLTLSGRLISD